MDASSDSTVPKGLRGWWLSPPRSGMRRFLAPWEYRHLRPFAALHIVGGTVALVLGGIVLSLVTNAWLILGVFWMVVALANYAVAYWELSIAESVTPQT
jgi:hypothetical protein